MKKLISLALAALLMLPLSSCGKDTKGVSSDKRPGSTVTENSDTANTGNNTSDASKDQDPGKEASDGNVNDTDGLIDSGKAENSSDASHTSFGRTL